MMLLVLKIDYIEIIKQRKIFIGVIDLKLDKKYISLFLCVLLVMTNNVVFANNVYLPQIGGRSAILLEANSGRILYANNANTKLPIASTTKIMTALLAIENGDLGQKVRIKSNSVGIEGSSIYLASGEEVTLRDLVYGLMLRSGNDAAVAIANHIGGSVDEFAKLMNKRAKEIGANNTHFTNPHGLHDDNHYSTAYDLALITKKAMEYDEFKKISKTKLWVADRDINQYFYNKNKTLWQYDGGDGVKIGYTRKAGRCLVSSATKDNMQLIAVVLDNYSWFNDCYKLFDYGFEKYGSMVIYDKNQLVKSIYVPNGKKKVLSVITKGSLILPLTEEEINQIKTNIILPDTLNAPIKKGDELGRIKVFMKGQLIYTDKLIARDNIYEKGFWDKTFEFIHNKISYK